MTTHDILYFQIYRHVKHAQQVVYFAIASYPFSIDTRLSMERSFWLQGS